MEDSLFGGTLGDALGVSQGQGRGLAQVFGDTYNPAFKEATTLQLKNDKEDKKALDSQLVKLAENKVWSRDIPIITEKNKAINEYVQKNYREIKKGNTPEALEYKNMITDATQFAYNSLAMEKATVDTLMKYNSDQTKYDPETKQLLREIMESPGDFDVSRLQLLPEFNKTKYEQMLSGNIKKLMLEDPKVSIPSGKDIHGNTIYKINQDVAREKLDATAQTEWDAMQPYQQKKYNNDFDAFKQMVYNYAPSKDRIEIKGKIPEISLGKKAEEMPFEFKRNQVLDFSQKVGSEEGKFGFTDDITTSLIGTDFNPNDEITYDARTIKSKGGVIIGLRGRYQATGKDGKYEIKNALSLKEGEDLFDGIFKNNKGEYKFETKSIQSLPVFKQGTKAKINGRLVDLSNTVVSDDFLKNGKVGDLVLSDKNVLFKPMVIGVFDTEINDRQPNVTVAIPYNEYRNTLQTRPNSAKQLLKLENQEGSKELLSEYSFSSGADKLGLKKQTNTQKINTTTEKYSKEEEDEYREYLDLAKKKNKKPLTKEQYFK